MYLWTVESRLQQQQQRIGLVVLERPLLRPQRILTCCGKKIVLYLPILEICPLYILASQLTMTNCSLYYRAPHPTGPWSEPVLVLNSTIWNEDYWPAQHKVAHCDANLNGIIRNDGSFLGLWRRCETSDLLTIPHSLREYYSFFS